MDLQRWKLFRELDTSLASECKIAKIIDGPIVGFLVLLSDDVYAVADTPDNFKYLGNGIHYVGAVVNQPSKVEALCGKGIVDFYGDLCSFSALTRDGCVYSWTCEEDSDCIADGMPRKVLFPGASSAEICQVSTGYFHTLCLTSGGEVFGWGYDYLGQLGLGSSSDRACDVKKIPGFSNDKIVQVAAGKDSSYALDCVGRVWSWGTWENKSLGYAADDDQLTPKQIENLPKIKKIAPGESHVLALSETGELYFWGKFNKDCDSDEESDADVHETHITPVKIIKEDMKTVIDIASSLCIPVAVCTTKDQVYLWGILFQQRITTPVATEFSSIEEVFACEEFAVMLQPINVKAKPPGVLDAWKRAFNDQSTADVVFSVENEKFYAHSVFLKFRSDYFRSMFDNEWKECRRGSGTIKIEGFCFRTFKAFMHFLYNESLIEHDLSLDDLTDLLKAADYYGDDQLRMACENRLKTKLTPENACLVYACAVKSNAENLQNYAVDYMVPVYREVVYSEACEKMDSDLKSKLMRQFADSSVFQASKKDV